VQSGSSIHLYGSQTEADLTRVTPMLRLSKTSNILLFVNRTVRDAKIYSSAIVVDPIRAQDLPEGRWRGRKLTRPERRVRWEILIFTTVSSGTQIGGPIVTYWDGMSFPSETDEVVWSLARNEGLIIVKPSPAPEAEGFFISGDRRAVAVVQDVVVQLDVTSVGDLPDLQANLSRELVEVSDVNNTNPTNVRDWFYDFDRRNAEGMNESQRRIAEQRLTEAEQIGFKAGDLLPVAIEGTETLGILELGEPTGRNEFRAKVRLVSPVSPITPGMRLKRTVRWESAGQPHEESRLIAIVVEGEKVSDTLNAERSE
jgi:hypothetical protein